MPQPYTITVTFAAEDINNTSDTYQLILTFEVDLSASNQAHSDSDKSLVILDHGKTKLDLNFDDLLLLPSEMEISISDSADYLHDILYGTSAEALALDKKFKVVVQLNAADEFIGHAIENTLSYDMGNKVFSFKVASRTDILKETLVFDDDGLAQDPLDYTKESTDNITALAIDYDGSTAKMQITHAGGTTYLADDIIKVTGISATERNINYVNRSYTVTDIDSSTLLRVLAQNSFEEDVDLTISFGTIVKIDIDSTIFKVFGTLLNDIYDKVNTASSVTIKHLWSINFGWTQAVRVTAASEAGGTVTITHDDNTGVLTQDGALLAADRIIFETFSGNLMTDLNAEFAVAQVNSANEFEITLTSGQTFSVGAFLRKITTIHSISNTAQIVDEAFQDNSNTGIKTLADILTALAIDWFSFTGMIHEEKTFFKQLNFYDSGDLNTLGEVLSHKKLHSMGTYSYIEVEKDVSSVKKTYANGDFTTLSGQTLTRKAFASIVQSKEVTVDGDFNYPHDFYDNTITHQSSIALAAVSVKDTSIALTDSEFYLWKPNLYYMSKFWFELLGQGSPYRREQFLVVGVDYDFLKGFAFNSGKYNIIGWEKNWNTGTTKLDAIYLGQV